VWVPELGDYLTMLSFIGTKCNSLTQQFIGISTTIDTWVTCFDSIESSSGPLRLQIQFYKVVKCNVGPQCLHTSYRNNMESYIVPNNTGQYHYYIQL